MDTSSSTPTLTLSQHWVDNYSALYEQQMQLFTQFQTSYLQSTMPTPQTTSSSSPTLSPLPTSTFPPDASPVPTLQPLTFPRASLFELSPVEANIFHTVRKIVQYYGLQCTPRVAGGWVRDKILQKDSHDIDIALENMEGEVFAHYIKEYSENVQDAELFDISGSTSTIISTATAPALLSPTSSSLLSSQTTSLPPQTTPKSKPISSISVIKSNPTQSKHLNTATFVLYGLPIDCSNLRTEVYAIDSRIPLMQMGSVRDDVIRRDFTCNALFYNIMTDQVEDICGRSKYDLDNKILSTPLHAFKTFNDDPLRVLRCVRFASRLRFDIDKSIYYAASHSSTHVNLCKKVSRERYGIELRKMFESFSSIQFSMSLLCQWKLRPIIFLLPIAPYLDFKPPIPLVRGKKNQAEQLAEIQLMYGHEDCVIKSTVAINPFHALRFPMYSLYDLSPRTILQAFYPQLLTEVLHTAKKEWIGKARRNNNIHALPTTMNDDISATSLQKHDTKRAKQGNNFAQHHIDFSTPSDYSFEFAPYTSLDMNYSCIHPSQVSSKQYDLVEQLYKDNKSSLLNLWNCTTVFHPKFVENYHPFDTTLQTTQYITKLKQGLVDDGDAVEKAQAAQKRPIPSYPPKLSFFTTHEDTCLTSLCSQSLSAFRILLEKVYKEYFCVSSLTTTLLQHQQEQNRQSALQEQKKQKDNHQNQLNPSQSFSNCTHTAMNDDHTHQLCSMNSTISNNTPNNTGKIQYQHLLAQLPSIPVPSSTFIHFKQLAITQMLQFSTQSNSNPIDNAQKGKEDKNIATIDPLTVRLRNDTLTYDLFNTNMDYGNGNSTIQCSKLDQLIKEYFLEVSLTDFVALFHSAPLYSPMDETTQSSSNTHPMMQLYDLARHLMNVEQVNIKSCTNGSSYQTPSTICDNLYDLQHITTARQMIQKKKKLTPQKNILSSILENGANVIGMSDINDAETELPSTLPTKLIIYRHDHNSHNSHINSSLPSSSPPSLHTIRDDCLSISGSTQINDHFAFKIPSSLDSTTPRSSRISTPTSPIHTPRHSGSRTVIIEDTTPPTYSIIPINPALFQSSTQRHVQANTNANDNAADNIINTNTNEEENKSNELYALQRALFTFFTSTSSPPNPLSNQFFSETLSASNSTGPTPPMISTQSHLHSLRNLALSNLSLLPPSSQQKHTSISATTPMIAPIIQSMPTSSAIFSSTDLVVTNETSEVPLADTEPILNRRFHTSHTPSSDVFRIALYASFLWPYFGFTTIQTKGKQKSLIQHFLVDSLKLSVIEGDTIEVLIESALTINQLSHQWVNVMNQIHSHVQNLHTNPQHHPPSIALNLSSSFSSFSSFPMKDLHYVSIDPIFAKRITKIQTTLGQIVQKTIPALVPGSSSTVSLSPTIYNSTLDIIILLAYHIQTIMNMPLYKLPQPQHHTSYSSTLQFLPTPLPPVLQSPSIELNSQLSLPNLSLQASQPQSQPQSQSQSQCDSTSDQTLPLASIIDTPQNTIAQTIGNKAHRQQSRTQRLTEMLQKHPLSTYTNTIASHNTPTASLFNTISLSLHNNDPNYYDAQIISQNDNQQQSHRIQIDPLIIPQPHHITPFLSNHLSTSHQHNPFDPMVTLSRQSSRSSHQTSQRGGGNNSTNIVALYDPLSPTAGVPIGMLPLPIQHHLAEHTPTTSSDDGDDEDDFDDDNNNDNDNQSDTNDKNGGDSAHTSSTRKEMPIPITYHRISKSHSFSTSTSTPTSNKPFHSSSSTPFHPPPRHQSQYCFLLPPQPKHTPFIHKEIPSIYSLFTFPGLSTTLHFNYTAPSANPHINNIKNNSNNYSNDNNIAMNTQTTPQLEVQRQFHTDALPLITYTTSHIIFTRHGFTTFYPTLCQQLFQSGNVFTMLSTISSSHPSRTTLTMNELLSFALDTLSANIPNTLIIPPHNEEDEEEAQMMKKYIAQQYTSLMIIYGLSQGYFALRTTTIASFAQTLCYNINTPPYSYHAFHSIKKPLLSGQDATKLTKQYASAITSPSPTISPLTKPNLNLQGQILGKFLDHLFELKCWYPYLDKDDLYSIVEQMVQNRLIPSNDGVMTEIITQHNKIPATKK